MPLIQSIRQRIANHPQVKASHAIAKSALSKHQQTLDGLTDILRPEDRRRQIEKAMRDLKTVEDISNARRLIAELSGDAAASAKARAHSILSETFEAYVKTLSPLLDAADEAVQDMLSEIMVAEEACFAGFGEARETTSLTRRAQAYADSVRAYRVSLADRGQWAHASLVREPLSQIIALGEA